MMPTDRIAKRVDQLNFVGRILFLTEDTSLIRRQLEANGIEARTLEDELAQRLMNEDLPLMNNISTDEITPGWVCFHRSRCYSSARSEEHTSELQSRLHLVCR